MYPISQSWLEPNNLRELAVVKTANGDEYYFLKNNARDYIEATEEFKEMKSIENRVEKIRKNSEKLEESLEGK